MRTCLTCRHRLHPCRQRLVSRRVLPSYQVTGLTCGHCAKSVTQALQALPQVDDVQIDLAAGGVSTVTVTGVVPPEMVRRAIEEAGYTVLS